MKQNNWTQQLRESKIGVDIEFPVSHYDNILVIRKRLTEKGEGVWTTSKSNGIFKVRRVS